MKKLAEHREAAFAEMQLPLWKANFWFSVLWVTMFVDIMDRSIMGGVPAPVITGAISDRLNLNIALQATAVISALLAIVFFVLASRYWKRDVERIRALGTFKFDQR